MQNKYSVNFLKPIDIITFQFSFEIQFEYLTLLAIINISIVLNFKI